MLWSIGFKPPKRLPASTSQPRMASELFFYIVLQVLRRFALQRLTAQEFLEFWLDVAHLGQDSELHAQRAAISAFKQLRWLVYLIVSCKF